MSQKKSRLTSFVDPDNLEESLKNLVLYVSLTNESEEYLTDFLDALSPLGDRQKEIQVRPDDG